MGAWLAVGHTKASRRSLTVDRVKALLRLPRGLVQWWRARSESRGPVRAWADADPGLGSIRGYRLRTDGLAWRQVKNEFVCLDLATSRYLSINSTGAAIWPFWSRVLKSMLWRAQLVSVFGIEPEIAARDASAFLSALVDRGLVEP